MPIPLSRPTSTPAFAAPRVTLDAAQLRRALSRGRALHGQAVRAAVAGMARSLIEGLPRLGRTIPLVRRQQPAGC